MSFWDLSDGHNAAAEKATEYEIPSGSIEPIPDGSTVLAMIDEARWDNKDGMRYVSLRWTIVQPAEFRNRKVFQKLWVLDDDPSAQNAEKAAKKRDKARRMLAAIDANAGGKLTSVPGVPTDESLTMYLTQKPMAIRVSLWEVDDRQTGEKIRGNWISAVSSKGTPTHVTAPKPAPAQAPRPAMASAWNSSIGDDEVPF